MKKKLFPVVIVAVMSLTAFTFFAAGNWKIADNFSIKFSSSNASGGFTSLKGDIQFDESNLNASSFNVTVDAASINTGIGLKNKHAKSDSWLDVAKYPVITFKSGKISRSAGGYEVTGTLDMHGVQKQITFPFTFKDNIFAATFNINRADYKIGSASSIDALVASNLKIDVVVPVSR